MIGGLSAGAASKVGSFFGNVGKFDFAKELARSLAHGSLGGLTSLAQGGKFKHGFFSGMFASMAGSGMEASKWSVFQSDVGSVVTAAVVGGTASGLGGGKFANGAVTGAYTMLFNHMVHQKQEQAKQKKPGQVALENAVEEAANLERERNIEYREHYYDPDFEMSSNISVKFPSQTESGYYLDAELFIGNKTLDVDILYRNYGDNIVTSFGWPRSQPFTAIRPAGPKIQAYTIFLKYNPNGEAVFLFFNNERDYSHFYNYILGK